MTEPGKKALLPRPPSEDCVPQQGCMSCTQSHQADLLKPAIHQGINTSFTQDRSRQPGLHATSTRAPLSIPAGAPERGGAWRAPTPAALHTTEGGQLPPPRTKPLGYRQILVYGPSHLKASCKIALCALFTKTNDPSRCKHDAKLHTAFKKNENSERTCWQTNGD